MKDSIIQLKGLTKSYGSLKAVDNLNLDIKQGEIFGLLGPNGAGKTTTILMLLGLSSPTSGTAYVCGYNATNKPIAVKRKVGYMPDNVGFYDNMTALENLMYIAQLNGLGKEEAALRANQLMEIVGLSHSMHKKTSTFSRGMKQRLGLADVLIKDPDVIVLDEPTLGIDPSGVKDFLVLIKQLSKQKGLTVLLSSHHLHHVQQVCDRVGIFVDGQLLADGSIDSLSSRLFGKNGHVTSITLQQPITRPWAHEETLKAWEGLKQVTIENNKIDFACSHDLTPRLVRFLVEKGYDISEVHKKDYGLDDIYEKYFEKDIIEHSNHEKSTGFFERSFFKNSKK